MHARHVYVFFLRTAGCWMHGMIGPFFFFVFGLNARRSFAEAGTDQWHTYAFEPPASPSSFVLHVAAVFLACVCTSMYTFLLCICLYRRLVCCLVSQVGNRGSPRCCCVLPCVCFVPLCFVFCVFCRQRPRSVDA